MRKYRLLVADDEPAPREGLAAFFRNTDCGFEVVGAADGGLQALAMAQEFQPDLLITDIRMPDMDGLELARRCLELPHAPKLLIMSSYDDAIYIKTALRLKAVDYLFKPLDLSELTAVIQQIREQLDRAEEEQRQKDIQREKLNHSIGWLRRHFLQEFVVETYAEEDEVREKLDFLNMKLPTQAKYCVVCVDMDARDMQRESGGQEDGLSFQGLLEDILSVHGAGYVFDYEKNGYVFLMMDDEGDSEGLMGAAEKLCREVIETMGVDGIRATVGLSGLAESRGDIPGAFRLAKENVKARLILGSSRVITDYKTAGSEKVELAAAAKAVKENLVASDCTVLEKAVNQYFDILGRRKEISLLYAIQCVSLLVGETMDILPGLSGKEKEGAAIQQETYDRLTQCETLPEMREVVAEYLVTLNEFICGCTHSAAEETVEKIKRIVRTQYMEQLSIQSIAEQVYLTPNYICMVFKQNVGRTINQYITEIRIEMAKRQLEDPAVRLADIGIMVGYTEPSYFSKIFKRYVALTPKEYRQMYISLKERQSTGKN